LVTVSNKSSNFGNGKAIERKGSASILWVANSLQANIAIVGTIDVGVNTSDCGIAGISGANILVITIGNGIGCVNTSSINITGLVGAKVVVVASNSSVGAHSGGGVASISGASIVIIAINRSSITSSVGHVTLDVEARDLVADNRNRDDTSVAADRGVYTTSSSYITGVGRAWAVEIAVYIGELASSSGYASSGVANIGCCASNGSINTSRGRVAGISGTEVIVVANKRRVSATRASNSISASINGARVVVFTAGGANASSFARAKSLASLATRGSRESKAGSSNQLVDDSCKIGEGRHGRERSGGS